VARAASSAGPYLLTIETMRAMAADREEHRFLTGGGTERPRRPGNAGLSSPGLGATTAGDDTEPMNTTHGTNEHLEPTATAHVLPWSRNGGIGTLPASNTVAGWCIAAAEPVPPAPAGPPADAANTPTVHIATATIAGTQVRAP
jgi:hypothetical protein